jgi:hypothetical protein
MTTPHEDMQAVLSGVEFKIEREDAYIISTKEASRWIPGVRLYLRTEKGRWKRALWLCANKANGPETIQSAMRSFVNALTAEADGQNVDGEPDEAGER